MKIVKVKWQDSATYREWYQYTELDLIAHPKEIESIGYLVKETGEFIILATNVDEHSCSAITQIPRKCISNLEELK